MAALGHHSALKCPEKNKFLEHFTIQKSSHPDMLE